MKNKKFIPLIIMGLTLLLAVAGCSNSDDKEYSISYSTWANPGEPAYKGMEKFKEIVEERTDGKITVDLFAGNQLGTTEEQNEQVKLGTIEMMSSGDPGMKEIEYLSLPYLMESNGHWTNVLNSDIGEQWNETLKNEMGLLNIGILPRGPRVISSNKEVNTPEDLKGMKLRAPTRDYYVKTFEALGANPTPMDFGEVYSGLQTGVVDGQENPLETFYSAGFQEVQDFIINSNHMFKPAFVTINNEFFEGLSDEYQQIILDAAEESQKFAEEELESSEAEMIKELEEAGITFIDPDIEKFKEATQSVRDELGEEIWGQEDYEKIVEMGREDLD